MEGHRLAIRSVSIPRIIPMGGMERMEMMVDGNELDIVDDNDDDVDVFVSFNCSVLHRYSTST
eukprot:13933144-Ditylum_brightwellii.AAC.1